MTRSKAAQQQQAASCIAEKPLAKDTVTILQSHGVLPRDNTFIRRMPLASREVPIVVFPKGLSTDVWQPLPNDTMSYVGVGGEKGWKDVLRPDHYYLLNVPAEATALAFSRLCHRNGDVGFTLNHGTDPVAVWPIIGSLFQRNVSVNNVIKIKAKAVPPAAVRQWPLLINAGSHAKDTLGDPTEVYYTTKPITLPEAFPEDK